MPVNQELRVPAGCAAAFLTLKRFENSGAKREYRRLRGGMVPNEGDLIRAQC